VTDAADMDSATDLQAEIARLRAEVEALRTRAEAAEAAADYDVLTPVLNRRGFVAAMSRTMAYCTRYKVPAVLLYLDLDGFKQVNDNYGHDAGDDVLCQLARRLEDVIRANESVARLGGDEFVVLLTNFGDLTHCEDILQRLLTEVARPLQIGPHSVQIQASIGVALYPSPGGRSDALLDQADQAMYRAKQAGKNCWRFYEP
jgi:diguanylate cyclase (GGDEF)-like protein